MDCHSDFFSLLALSQLHSSSSLNLATSCSAATGVAPTLDGRGVHHTVSGLLESTHNSMAHAHGLSPVLVASQHSVKDIEMIDASSTGSVLSASCRKFSGLKRKRDGQGLAVGDDVSVAGSTDYWAAMPMANDLRDEDLQPDEHKRMCTESDHTTFYPHHHPFTTPTNHNGITHHISPYLLANVSCASNTRNTESSSQPHPSVNESSYNSSYSLNGVGEQCSNVFANQKLNLCTAGSSMLEEEAGSCMHIHVPGVSVTECPRCLAGEPVYAINTGTYGTLQSIFQYNHGHQLS